MIMHNWVNPDLRRLIIRIWAESMISSDPVCNVGIRDVKDQKRIESKSQNMI